ncbi:MAG: hypothetical protein OER86_03890 [Phycisphaerae bacterium]|nr:hypothetical protein [Phycisphaerae bacterium]
MTRTELAGYGLMVSAFLITAILFVQAADYLENRAQAEMVVNKGLITMVSTRYTPDVEIIYVLDSRDEILMAYTFDRNKKAIILLQGGVMDIATEFERRTGSGTPSTRTGTRRPR